MHFSTGRAEKTRALHGEVREVSMVRVDVLEPVVIDDCFFVKLSRGVADVAVVQHMTTQGMARRKIILIRDRFYEITTVGSAGGPRVLSFL